MNVPINLNLQDYYSIEGQSMPTRNNAMTLVYLDPPKLHSGGIGLWRPCQGTF